MKKQFLVCLMAAMTFGGMFTSCDDDDTVVISMEETVFNNTNGLELTYSGAPLLGKQAVFSPTDNNTKATIVLSGADFSVEGMPFMLPGSGVIPGKEKLTLNVDLTANGDIVTFEGTEVIEGDSVTYKGSAHKSFLKLDLKVVMPENPLTNKVIYSYKGEKENSGFDPLILDWCYMKSFGFDFDGDGKPDMTEDHAFNLYTPMFGMKLIDGMSVPEFLYGVLSEVKFLPDGNIQAMYKDTPADPAFKASPLNIASYQFVEDGKIKLFLNPDMIHYITSYTNTLASRAGMDEALTEGIAKALALVNGCMKNGIAMGYEKNEKGYLEFYLDDATIARPLFSILVPILQEPAIQKILESLVKDNLPEGLVIMGMPVTPDFAWKMISSLLKSMPEYLETTKYIKLGMVFSENPKTK